MNVRENIPVWVRNWVKSLNENIRDIPPPASPAHPTACFSAFTLASTVLLLWLACKHIANKSTGLGPEPGQSSMGAVCGPFVPTGLVLGWQMPRLQNNLEKVVHISSLSLMPYRLTCSKGLRLSWHLRKELKSGKQISWESKRQNPMATQWPKLSLNNLNSLYLADNYTSLPSLSTVLIRKRRWVLGNKIQPKTWGLSVEL